MVDTDMHTASAPLAEYAYSPIPHAHPRLHGIFPEVLRSWSFSRPQRILLDYAVSQLKAALWAVHPIYVRLAPPRGAGTDVLPNMGSIRHFKNVIMGSLG